MLRKVTEDNPKTVIMGSCIPIRHLPYLLGSPFHPLMSIYTDNGYANRKEYLDELREEYGNLVDILIGVLPSSEDFDGLVIALEDATESEEYSDLM